jgi:hypothetical protein
MLQRRSAPNVPHDLASLASRLERGSEADRVAFVRSLTKSDMGRLWVMCEGRGVTVDDFVPAGTRLGREVVHAGKNSLPAFNLFEKRFTPADGNPTEVYGYNHTWFAPAIGPGYFVGRFDPTEGAFGLDYYRTPPAGAPLPASWPKIRANTIGPQMLIFANMIDYMRKVCDGVTIGRAWRKGQRTDNYFVLARTTR